MRRLDMKKTHVVFKGEAPCIYFTWQVVSHEVVGFSAAFSVSFAYREEAIQSGWDIGLKCMLGDVPTFISNNVGEPSNDTQQEK
ncbi:Ribosomal protein L9/RNase H1, N-terminal [Sesbania bispinosa]|nr:Ribosomal protein L9/RNase H1, N-terminal [Sesbania bispinosa]